MSNLEKAKQLLQQMPSDVFVFMVSCLGINEDALYELACDILELLTEKDLIDFVKICKFVILWRKKNGT